MKHPKHHNSRCKSKHHSRGDTTMSTCIKKKSSQGPGCIVRTSICSWLERCCCFRLGLVYKVFQPQYKSESSDISIGSCAGSNVSLTLYFLRFALWINVLMLAIWGVLAVFPFFLSPPTNFSWKTFTDTSPSYMIQGYGLDDTFLVYGQNICFPLKPQTSNPPKLAFKNA